MAVRILISLNIILIGFSSYITSLCISQAKNIEQKKAVEMLVESNVNSTDHQTLKIVCFVISLVVITYISYNLANYVSDTAIFKIAKIVDKGLANTIDFICPPQTTMQFVEKSSGLDVIIEISGDYCLIKILDNIDKCMKPLNEIITKQEIQNILPSDETLDLAFSIWS